MIEELNTGFSNIATSGNIIDKPGLEEGVNTKRSETLKNLNINVSRNNQFTTQTSDETILATVANDDIRPKNILDDIPGNTLEEIKFDFDDFIFDAQNRRIEFSKDDETGKTIIKIINTETEEVVRQVPPQEFLNFVRNLNKVAEEIFKGLPKFI